MTWSTEKIADLCLTIQGIPSPTGQEHERAEFVAAQLSQMGLEDVKVDDVPNVYARVKGSGNGPGLMVSAHLDTVFPNDTDLTSRREGAQLFGPGIGDNSMGLTGLLAVAQTLARLISPISPEEMVCLAHWHDREEAA